MSSNRRFKSSLELSTSASGSPLIARPDAVVGNSTQTSIGHSQKHLLKKFAPTFERYQTIGLGRLSNQALQAMHYRARLSFRVRPKHSPSNESVEHV